MLTCCLNSPWQHVLACNVRTQKKSQSRCLSLALGITYNPEQGFAKIRGQFSAPEQSIICFNVPLVLLGLKTSAYLFLLCQLLYFQHLVACGECGRRSAPSCASRSCMHAWLIMHAHVRHVHACMHACWAHSKATRTKTPAHGISPAHTLALEG